MNAVVFFYLVFCIETEGSAPLNVFANGSFHSHSRIFVVCLGFFFFSFIIIAHSKIMNSIFMLCNQNDGHFCIWGGKLDYTCFSSTRFPLSRMADDSSAHQHSPRSPTSAHYFGRHEFEFNCSDADAAAKASKNAATRLQSALRRIQMRPNASSATHKNK